MASIQGNINQLLTLAGAGAYGLRKIAESDLATAKDIYNISKAQGAKEYARAEKGFQEAVKKSDEFEKANPKAKEAMNMVYNPEEDAPSPTPPGSMTALDKLKEASEEKKGIPGLKRLTKFYKDYVPETGEEYKRATAQINKSVEAGKKAMERMRANGLGKVKVKHDFEDLYDKIAEDLPGISQEAAEYAVRNEWKKEMK